MHKTQTQTTVLRQPEGKEGVQRWGENGDEKRHCLG